MPELKKKREGHGLTPPASQGFRSLLVPVDLSPLSDRVVGRVPLLPLAAASRLTLLHVVPASLPAPAQRSAAADARRFLEDEARSLRARLPGGATVEPRVQIGAPEVEIARHAAAVKAELIVMGRGGGRALRDTFLGSTAERVLRRGQLPILVVRLPPRAAYRRPALALDVDRAAPQAAALLLRTVPPPRPEVDVIHAYDTPYSGFVYSSLPADEVEDFHEQCCRAAALELAKLLSAALARAKVAPGDAPSWRIRVRHGSPRTIVARAVKQSGADLLVLGTNGYSGVARVLLGTVAGEVLREVACDVLVVPPRRDR